MMRRVNVFLIAAMLAVAGRTGWAASDESGALEAALIAAMSQNSKGGGRSADSGEAIRAYIKAGYVARKPEKRLDYTDYRLLRKPAALLGYPLLILEEEYPSKFIGCCVSPGTGAVVGNAGDTRQLGQFAKKNGCSVSVGEDAEEPLKRLGIRPDKGPYARLSCRERDAEK